MYAFMKYIVFLILFSVSFMGVSQSKTGTQSKKTPPSKTGVKPVAVKKTATIALTDNIFDFGNVREGDFVTHRVWLQNIGGSELAISDISAPCITADYNFSPLKVWGKTYIDITFSTEGKVGTQYREVLIKGNIENKEDAIIYVKGVIYPRR